MSDGVIDVEEFLERVQDDKELFFELLEIFSEDFVEKRTALGTAVESQDFEQIRSVAHSLKGASGNISAKALRAVCLRLEEMGRNNDLGDIDKLLTDLDQTFTDLTACIEELKKEG